MDCSAKQPKTPWNPSVRATARVLNPLPAPTECPHCGGPVEVMHHDRLYGREYGNWPWAYACTKYGCGAYVGMHPFTNIPLGTLATKAIRDARNRCKLPFLKLTEKMRRTEAYQALADKLGIPFEQCHFGWFDVEMCERARIASIEIYKEIE
jgi:hypothetical protein